MAGPVGPGAGYQFKTPAQRAAEAKERRALNMKRAVVVAAVFAVVAFGAGWNPPTGSIHSFTAASNYKVETNSGCTNSGKGCHGAESSYNNFNDYHPGASCTTCHGVQGVACIPCHIPNKNHECQTCHDGSMEEAQNVGNLSAEYPKGHYRETSHTAMGTDYNTVVYATNTGAANAPCSQCHSQALGASHTGVVFTKGSGYFRSLACGQCHNDEKTGALVQVTSKWKAQKCENCHDKSSSAPMHSASIAPAVKSTGDSGCAPSGGGCHFSGNLHALHADKPAKCSGVAEKGERPCHAARLEAAVSTATLCGGDSQKACHRFDDQQHYGEPTHTATGDDFAFATYGSAGGTARATCAVCHSQTLQNAHTGVAPAAGSPYGATLSCTDCHNDIKTDAEAVVIEGWRARTCEDCHAIGGPAPMHATGIAPPVPANDPLSCGSTGGGCHSSDNLHALHANAPSNCSGSAAAGEPGCHSLGGVPNVPSATTCGSSSASSCHRGGASGTYNHKNSGVAHSPTNDVPASDTSYYSVACGSCHRMQPDNVSLIDEHGLATSTRTVDPGNVCFDCHKDPAAFSAIQDRWSARNTTGACAACHGKSGLPAAHQGDIGSMHTAPTGASAGCASSGAGCHPTADLHEVGKPTVSANIHTTCLRCHDWRASAGAGSPIDPGDQPYQPSKKSCGAGRDCHGTDDPSTSVHVSRAVGSAPATVDGTDPQHDAGAAQADASWDDTASGLSVPCKKCHVTVLQTEHMRPNSVLSTATPNACYGCHNAALSSASVVKADWPRSGTASACAECHAGAGVSAVHSRIATSMIGVELNVSGAAAPGYCVAAGCHTTLDLRPLHAKGGCTIPGCHRATGDIDSSRLRSCGGDSTQTACHAGFSATNHDVDHTALPTGDSPGVSQGVTYTVGGNVGCFGCHFSDLQDEHANALKSGTMRNAGSQVSGCETCHYSASDPNRNPSANLAGVKAAVANHDHRCDACHASGSAADGPTFVASPHRQTTTTPTWDATSNVPPGRVWTDPFSDWKTALDSTTGGGHNALPFDAVGASKNKSFPVTTFTAIGLPPLTYTWSLPNNSGASRWLRAGPLVSPSGTQTVNAGWSVSTTAGIQAAHVTCSDCHDMPSAMTGPQGAAVTIYITPGYSATEYSNPTTGTFQFDPYNVDPTHTPNPVGYKPVICYKCHTIFSGSIPGTLGVGGTARHDLHKWHTAGAMAAYCTDCHVAIPHAWNRPRLLLRTATNATDTAPLDSWPYASGKRPGLLGLKLQSIVGNSGPSRSGCAVGPGGCHDNPPTAASHPSPAAGQTTGWSYWP